MAYHLSLVTTSHLNLRPIWTQVEDEKRQDLIFPGNQESVGSKNNSQWEAATDHSAEGLTWE